MRVCQRLDARSSEFDCPIACEQHDRFGCSVLVDPPRRERRWAGRWRGLRRVAANAAGLVVTSGGGEQRDRSRACGRPRPVSGTGLQAWVRFLRPPIVRTKARVPNIRRPSSSGHVGGLSPWRGHHSSTRAARLLLPRVGNQLRGCRGKALAAPKQILTFPTEHVHLMLAALP